MSVSLKRYKRHVELFGGDMILETAAGDLPDEQLDALSRFIKRQRKLAQQHKLERLRAKGRR